MLTFCAMFVRLLGAISSVILICTLIAACKPSREDLTVWKAQVPSPNGEWLATADTVQNGGFGSADIYTSVHLKPTHGNQPPVDVLGIDSQGPIPHPYVLDNAANKGGSIDLTMTWLTPTHLQITYADQPCTVVNLQMVKYARVEITLQALGQHRPC